MLSDQQRKAELARLKVESRALELGIVCSRPAIEGTRYDCILDAGGKLFRVQIKYCDCRAVHASGAVQLRLRSTAGQGAGRCYTKDEVDALVVYLPALDRLCFFPQDVFCGKTAIHIRLQPALNGQTKGCLLAENYFW
ncbi:MAG: group I intron-associated PD-(D/E)XK endonuclease [Pyrinomonadaceae bacterium]